MKKLNIKITSFVITEQLLKSFSNWDDDLKKNDIKKFNEVLIAHPGLDEAYAYNVTNFINNIASQVNIGSNIRLAHSYDYPNQENDSSSFWIIISENMKTCDKTFLSYLDSDQYIDFDFNTWKPSKQIVNMFLKPHDNRIEITQSIWSTLLAFYLTEKLFIEKILLLDKADHFYRKFHFETESQLNSFVRILNDRRFHNSLQRILTSRSKNIIIKKKLEVYR